MRLEDERESSNVEDRRGGGMGKAGGIGIGTIVIALVASYFLGIDPSTVLNVAQQVQGPQASTPGKPLDPRNDPDHALKSEISKVLAKTEDTWSEIFPQIGGRYEVPRLVLYSGRTPTACGTGQAAMGPFYCPGDRKVYLDMHFFREMEGRFKAGGDFARAYVIAHEIGHHVQNLIGITGKTDELRGRVSEKEYNRISVRVELQADCFAGVWANHANRRKPFLDSSDVDEALRAANAIGDDMLQKQSSGVVVPDAFTHGTSQQRMRWFRTGFESGSMKSCDTFAARDLG
ncbi:MAG TPA: neutral zinc metallopeptidase [Usitatibacteraceae bacterium]|nr:neutral zinc metallopeptidase [Usitatibacteraceae bacterium]